MKLTKRELQVAELLAWGASKKEIPGLLHKDLSVRTIENITRNIYEKLGLGKVNELSAWYFVTFKGVDPNDSPLRKRVIATCLLLILLPTLILTNTNFVRIRGSRSVKTASWRGRPGRKTLDFYPEFEDDEFYGIIQK